jgi:hypothetical protein
MWPFKTKPNKFSGDLNAALEKLGQNGIKLKPNKSIDDIIFSLDIKNPNVKIDPIELLCIMGGEGERKPFEPLSNDIWHMDAECIDDNDSYKNLAQRFINLAKGDLYMSEMNDLIDFERNKAYFSYLNKDGKVIKYDLSIDNDWVDPKFYTNMQEMVGINDKKFMIVALGQDSLISYGNDELKNMLSNFIGIEFQWE